MNSSSLKPIFVIILILMLLVTLFSGCLGGDAPNFPIEALLSFSESPVLNKSVQATFTFKLIKNYFKDVVRDAEIKINLEEGFQLIDGNLEYKSDIARDNALMVKIMVKTIKTGTWYIGAHVWSETDGANGFDWQYVTVTENSVSLSKRLSSSPTRSPVPTSAPSDNPK
jgi:hypothetical protein